LGRTIHRAIFYCGFDRLCELISAATASCDSWDDGHAKALLQKFTIDLKAFAFSNVPAVERNHNWDAHFGCLRCEEKIALEVFDIDDHDNYIRRR
jgi:hypothetical protein